MTVTLRYFAWVRERVGFAEETIELPASIKTLGELILWQKTRNENFAFAFEDHETIRAAIDKKHKEADAAVEGATEIAFFPPMTGG